MAVNTAELEGQDHIIGEGPYTRCGILVPFGVEWKADAEPENPCPVCFPDAKPKKGKAKSGDKA